QIFDRQPRTTAGRGRALVGLRSPAQRLGVAVVNVERARELGDRLLPPALLQRSLAATEVILEVDLALLLGGDGIDGLAVVAGFFDARELAVGGGRREGLAAGLVLRRRGQRRGRTQQGRHDESEGSQLARSSARPVHRQLARVRLSSRSLMPSWFMRSWTLRPDSGSASRNSATRERSPAQWWSR